MWLLLFWICQRNDEVRWAYDSERDSEIKYNMQMKNEQIKIELILKF